ncbi:uncharacterized protein LOC114165520 [Vigna unguiculata]|uniref:uncharacterized protein LOC114165520 n=1 Tax=Vigna unguiculata TaxID=3917 RepID=UPI0010170D36|nr:uncharacterized protein LOC114165520 [Vigna unguiculata]
MPQSHYAAVWQPHRATVRESIGNAIFLPSIFISKCVATELSTPLIVSLEDKLVGSEREIIISSERVADDDDGFGIDNVPQRNFQQVLERWNRLKAKSNSGRKKRNVGEGSFVTNDCVGQHEINEEYDSEQLCSDVDSDKGVSDKMPKFVKYNAEDMNKSFKFKLRMEFCSFKDFKHALIEHSVLNGKEIKFVKNDYKRVRVVCKKKCGFLIMVSKVGGSQTFRVKTLVGSHRCGRVMFNKNANKDWIAQVLLDKFLDVGNMTVNQIIDEVRKNYSVGVTPWRAARAKEIAMDCMVGDGQRQYALLYDYVAELLRVKGFLAGCRPFIGVDGCHLKTTYGGQLLVAIGRDPNDQYFPLAFVVVENECKETWRWFLSLLLEDIGDIQSNRWVFISDQQKGLMTVFDEILEGVEHRFCLRHLYSNFKKRFGGGVVIRDLMMGVAKATFYQAWEKNGHAVVAIHYKIENPEDYVHPYYKKNAYLACYGPEITPINGQQMWPKSDFPELLPPIFKTPPGRPKKLRMREVDEHRNTQRNTHAPAATEAECSNSAQARRQRPRKRERSSSLAGTSKQ